MPNLALTTKKNMITHLLDKMSDFQGRVAAPVLMYFLGVPGFICFLAWLFFFRGR
jgi:hypothetical protein